MLEQKAAKNAEDEQDIAWVWVTTPLSVPELRDFCADLERLYRINPMLEFKSWREEGPGHYHLHALNLSNGQEVNTRLRVEEVDNGIKIHYDTGLKNSSLLQFETQSGKVGLRITDDYSGIPANEREKRLDEVDRSLEIWGREIYKFLETRRRWSWLPLYNWYTRRLWLPMKPMGRRIAYMLLIITAFEILAFLLLIAVYKIDF